MCVTQSNQALYAVRSEIIALHCATNPQDKRAREVAQR
jgi:hypothetical protein